MKREYRDRYNDGYILIDTRHYKKTISSICDIQSKIIERDSKVYSDAVGEIELLMCQI